MRAEELLKPLRSRLTVLLVLLAAVRGLLLPGAKPAGADTGFRQVGWTWMRIDNYGNEDLARAYEALTISIRNAADHKPDRRVPRDGHLGRSRTHGPRPRQTG